MVSDPKQKRKKLYDGLYEKGLYTKSYEDFDAQFSTPEKIEKLHGKLKERGLYTKEAAEFNEQFFSDKKKVDTLDSLSGLPESLPEDPLTKNIQASQKLTTSLSDQGFNEQVDRNKTLSDLAGDAQAQENFRKLYEVNPEAVDGFLKAAPDLLKDLVKNRNKTPEQVREEFDIKRSELQGVKDFVAGEYEGKDIVGSKDIAESLARTAYSGLKDQLPKEYYVQRLRMSKGEFGDLFNPRSNVSQFSDKFPEELSRDAFNKWNNKQDFKTRNLSYDDKAKLFIGEKLGEGAYEKLKEQFKIDNEEERLGFEKQIQQQNDEASKATEGVVSDLKSVKGAGDFLSFAGNMLGQALYRVPVSLATGTTGSIIAESAAVYDRQLDLIAEKEGISREEVIKKGLDKPAEGQALSVLAGTLDAASNFNLIGLFKNAATKELKESTVKQFVKGFVKGGTPEALTEGAQTELEEYAASKGAGVDYELDGWRLATSTVGGLIGGGVLGSAANVAGSKNKTNDTAQGQPASSEVKQEADNTGAKEPSAAKVEPEKPVDSGAGKQAGEAAVKLRKFYRGGAESSMPKGLTAEDVVNFERDELGNDDVVAEKGVDLKKVKSDNLLWLAENEEYAKEFGDAQDYEIEEGKYRIVARDDSGGVLVERIKTPIKADPVKRFTKEVTGTAYHGITGNGGNSKGIYLGEKDLAADYGDGEIVKYDYSLKNPLIIENDGDFDVVKKLMDDYLAKNPNAKFHPDTTDHVNKELEKIGYDGLIIKEESIKTDRGYDQIVGSYGEPQVIVFDRKNVKESLVKDGAGVTPKVDKPVQQDAKGTKKQGSKKPVQQGADGVRQGEAEAATPVLDTEAQEIETQKVAEVKKARKARLKITYATDAKSLSKEVVEQVENEETGEVKPVKMKFKEVQAYYKKREKAIKNLIDCIG